MDLRSFKLHLVDGRVRAVIADADGERGRDLSGAAFSRVAAAAGPLLDVVRAAAGGQEPRAISVDAVGRVLRASLATPAAGPAGGDGDADEERCAVTMLRGADFEDVGVPVSLVARAIAAELGVRGTDPPLSPSDPQFWGGLYRARSDGWELGRPSPPIERFFDEHSPAGRRALVPGCGRAHEARMLARRGARVTAIDLAEEAIAEARRFDDPAAPVELRVADLFALPAEAPGGFDLIVEHTCFCAIDPARRDEYVEAAATLLAPGGELVGLFFAHGRPGGPPFSTTADEVRARFSPRFEIVQLETARGSVAARAGQELLARFVRR